MNFWTYVNEATGSTKAEVAREVGLRPATVIEWDSRGTLPAIETALKVADVYDLPRLATLVAAGFLHPGEAITLRTATTQQLKRELARRTKDENNK